MSASLTNIKPEVHGKKAYAASRYGVVPVVSDTVRPGDVRVGEKAAASFLGVHHTTLAKWRRHGNGPKWYLHMDRIAYDVAALEEFAAQRDAGTVTA
jgi:hypothetical protein